MDSVSISIPKTLDNCTFTQGPIKDPIRTICEHFFERGAFSECVDGGGRVCPLCKRDIEWYVVEFLMIL